VLNGTKTWISNGIEGSCFALLVRPTPRLAALLRYEPIHRPQGTGLQGRPQAREVGLQVDRSAELIFEDYRLPADHLIGEVEVAASPRSQAAGARRINVAARGVRHRRGRAETRHQLFADPQDLGKPICEHQAIQLKLGEMATRPAPPAC